MEQLTNVAQELAKETIAVEMKPAPLPLHLPKVPRGLTWDQTQAATVMMMRAWSDM
jgi:hypothetical protein